MEQRDYLLREIERIGQVLRAILNRLTGRGPTPALSMDNQFEETKNELLDMANFDLSEFLQMNGEKAIDYIKSLSGFSITNIEELALILELLADDANLPTRMELLQKALLMLNYCKEKDKTFSMERENKILRITEGLHKS
jgi:hypothetical protein